jgi:glycerol uptake facilitator-like aquaporin
MLASAQPQEARTMPSSRSAPIAEPIGTLLFFFVGAGSIVLDAYLVASGGSGVGLLEVAPAHGLALAVLAPALGVVSGAHFNPAVTLAVWIMGKITVPRALGDAASFSSHSLVGRIA